MMTGTWQEVTLKSAHELAPREANVSGESIYNRIRGACDVVMMWDVAVEALVDSKEAQQVCQDLVRRGAAGSLLEEGVKVVCLAKDRALADVKLLCEGFKMAQPPCKLQVRVSDRSSRFCVGDEEARNVRGPA